MMKQFFACALFAVFVLGSGSASAAPVVQGSDDATRSFQLVRDQWLQRMNYDSVELLIGFASEYLEEGPESKKLIELASHRNLEDQILDIKRNTPVKISKNGYKFVVGVRESAQLIRTVERFMDSRHKPNEDLNELAIALGDFKDALAAESRRKKTATRLMRILAKANVRLLATDFIPATEESIHTFVDKRLDILNASFVTPADEEAVITKKGNLKLHEEAFHEIRKTLRDFYLLLQLENYIQPNKKPRQMIVELDGIVKEMGKIRDDLVQQTMDDKAQREEVILKVPKLAKVLAAELTEFIQSGGPKERRNPEAGCSLLFRPSSIGSKL